MITGIGHIGRQGRQGLTPQPDLWQEHVLPVKIKDIIKRQNETILAGNHQLLPVFR